MFSAIPFRNFSRVSLVFQYLLHQSENIWSYWLNSLSGYSIHAVNVIDTRTRYHLFYIAPIDEKDGYYFPCSSSTKKR
jgi:hypothetical protein